MERAFQLMVEAVHDYAILMLDPDGVVRTWNAGAQAIKGWTAEEIVGRSFKAFYTPESVASGHPDRELVVAATQGTYEEEGWRVRKDGSQFWANVLITAVRDEQGELVGFGKVTRDLTERKRAEDRLAQAERRFRRAFDEAPTGAALLDAAGRLTGANQALGAILGRPADELVGELFDVLFPGDGDGFAELSAGPTTWNGREVDRWGVARWVDISLVRLSEPGEQGSHLVHVLDVSQRRAYEQQLAELADTDALTGLLNRRRFGVELATHLERVRRHGPAGALLMLDLDNFKAVNDALGHRAGDELLVEVARVLSRSLRAGDLVCRLGGDEFAVLLTGAEPGAATEVAALLVERVREQVRAIGTATGADVSVSVGVAVVDRVGMSSLELMGGADTAMYAAKQAGRNRWALRAV